jgi:hypothetical protein
MQMFLKKAQKHRVARKSQRGAFVYGSRKCVSAER